MATSVTTNSAAKSLAVTALLYSSERYSDLVIKCEDKTFNVHRSVVCLQSKPIARMVDGGFKEGISKIAEFPENDPIILEKMIEYMYLGDYSDGRRQPPVEAAVVDREPSRSQKYKKCTVFDDSDDPDKTTVTRWESVAEPEINVKTFEEPDYISKWPADWFGAPFLNAQVYAIAEQYDVTGLKELASIKYTQVLPTEWNSASFVASLRLMYELIPESDRLLKDVALKTAGAHSKELTDCGEFVQLCKENGEIALDVLMATLAFIPKDAVCTRCHRSDYVSPKGNTKGVQYYCTNCHAYFIGVLA